MMAPPNRSAPLQRGNATMLAACIRCVLSRWGAMRRAHAVPGRSLLSQAGSGPGCVVESWGPSLCWWTAIIGTLPAARKRSSGRDQEVEHACALTCMRQSRTRATACAWNHAWLTPSSLPPSPHPLSSPPLLHCASQSSLVVTKTCVGRATHLRVSAQTPCKRRWRWA
jgi:hypothetical protein